MQLCQNFRLGIERNRFLAITLVLIKILAIRKKLNICYQYCQYDLSGALCHMNVIQLSDACQMPHQTAAKSHQSSMTHVGKCLVGVGRCLVGHKTDT